MKALRMLAKKLGVTPEYLETGSELDGSELRELRLAEQELRLRLDGARRRRRGRARAARGRRGRGRRGGATRARIVLGLEAAARGDHAGTIEQLSQVVGSELVTAASRPDVYSTLGRAYAAAGSPREAVTLFEQALEEVGRVEPENVHARVRYSTYLSYALTDLGELQRAKAVVGELFAGGGVATDRYTRVRLYWSLGRLSLEQAKPHAALDSFRRAVALLEATEDTVHLARAHMACADATITAGDDFGAALHHLDEAERLLGPAPAAEDLARSGGCRRCARRRRRLGGGRASRLAGAAPRRGAAERARERLVGDRRGACRRRCGAEPTRPSREALALLGEHGTVREHAAVLRSYGRYLRDAGREREALDVFERAAEVASNLQGEPTSTDR